MIDVVDTERAVNLLAGGAVVAVPTDTVYGVAASLSHPSALATLFALKRRPDSLALPVLVGSVEQIEVLGVTWPERARQLASVFWPGALTIVVPVPQELARRVGSPGATAGFRIPDDPVLHRVLARSGALAVTSANEHGQPPCRDVAQVQRAFAGREELAGVVDGGARSGEVSTVVELTDSSWRVVREGAIDASAIGAVLDGGSPTQG